MTPKKEAVRQAVRKGYAAVAKGEGSCCGPQAPCCGDVTAETISRKIGYSEEDVKAVPAGANLGLGCGNPIALASLKRGETVVDLGAGAGFDCFLAAKRVGPVGRVIGVDMTPEMIDKARANARKGKHRSVEFRLGEIEHLPVADSTADVIISNCVINLAPAKRQVFREAFRILKPGGRLAVSDIVLLRSLPAAVRKSVAAYVGCLSGAIRKDDYLRAIRAAGFQCVRVVGETSFPVELMANDPAAQAAATDLRIPERSLREIVCSVVSVSVEARKPAR
jgi:SAM-dependent methyltransferase